MTDTDPPAKAFKIYFAGAIRAGREDASLYADLIRYLGRFGTVLTAHVGDAALLAAEQFLTEAEIFHRDMQWLEAADFVVAEVSTPSLGVGFEIGMAQTMGKEICCLYRRRQGISLSAMIIGNQALSVHAYAEYGEAERLLANFVDALAKSRERGTDRVTPSPAQN